MSKPIRRIVKLEPNTTWWLMNCGHYTNQLYTITLDGVGTIMAYCDVCPEDKE